MRVSERQRYDTTTTRVETAKGTNAQQLEIMASQKRINHLSDDPIGAGQAVRTRNRVGNIRQYQKNIEFSKGFLERSEAAISSMQDNLIRAKELAVNLSNSTNDADARRSAANEIKQIMEEMVSLGNTTYANRYVFSGFRSQTPALSSDGHYLGDDGAVYLQLDSNDFRQVNLNARGLFEASPEEQQQRHFNMMDCLQVLHDGLTGNHIDNILTAMDELDYQMQKVTSHQATLGAIQNGLSSSLKRLELDEELFMSDLSRIEDADIFKVTSDFKRTEAVLQSTLLASNKLLQPSLLNFMQ